MSFEEEITVPLVDADLKIHTTFRVKEGLWRRFEKACRHQEETPKEVLIRSMECYVIGDKWSRGERIREV